MVIIKLIKFNFNLIFTVIIYLKFIEEFFIFEGFSLKNKSMFHDLDINHS